jgi:hypothetical protein
MEFLKQNCLDNLPRLLACGDWNTASLTYGCWDRSYWHYKTSDFPSAGFQSAVLSLALLYRQDLPGNYLYHNPKVLAMLNASLRFWAKLKGHKGSFNEWYPNEYSLVATAFTAYAVSETFLLLQEELQPQVRDETRGALAKAAQFLSTRHDPLSNHTAGAIAALYNIYLILQETTLAKVLERKLKSFLKAQDSEGWWEEYGGADLGYLSVTVDYLIKYYRKSGDEKILPALQRALEFMTVLAPPDGSWGGEFASRNTKYLMPHGLAFLAPGLPQAGHLLEHFLKGLSSGTLPNLSHFDERYLLFFFYPNYLQAALALNGANLSEADMQDAEFLKPFEKHFPTCGLFSKKTPAYFSLCGIKKGGMLKVYNQAGAHLCYSDSGYWLKLKEHQGSTQYLKPQENYDFQPGNNWTRVKLQRAFKLLPSVKLTPFKYLILRLFNLTLGNLEFASGLLRRALQKATLYLSKELPVTLEREIFWEETKITIKDVLSLKSSVELESLKMEGAQSWTASPTGKYILAQDFQDYGFPDLSVYFKDRNTVIVTYTLSFAPEYNLNIEVK